MVEIVNEITATAQITPEIEVPEPQVTEQVVETDSEPVEAQATQVEETPAEPEVPPVQLPLVVDTVPRGISEERRKLLLEAPLSVNPATRFRQLLARPGIIVSRYSFLLTYAQGDLLED